MLSGFLDKNYLLNVVEFCVQATADALSMKMEILQNVTGFMYGQA